VSSALRQAKQYSGSVRCTASAALPQILAAHNGTTRVTIKYRQPLPPARSLHRSYQHLRTHLADLQPQSHLRLPDLHGITWLCSTAGLFVSNLRI
jgi:hypothetical protein